jgi:Mrr restriction endonuclease-like protein
MQAGPDLRLAHAGQLALQMHKGRPQTCAMTLERAETTIVGRRDRGRSMRFPTRALIKPLILDLLNDGQSHLSDESQRVISRQLRLSAAQLAVRLGNKHRAFQNEHAFALSELVTDGYIAKGGERKGSGIYQITASGRRARRAELTLSGEEHRRLWKDVDAREAARAQEEARGKSRRSLAAARLAWVPSLRRTPTLTAPTRCRGFRGLGKTF